MAARKITRIGDVHLHRRRSLVRLQDFGQVHAIVERGDAAALARLVQVVEVGFALATAHLKRLLGASKVEPATMRTAGRHLEVVPVARLLEHGRQISAHGVLAPLDKAQLLGQVEVARHLGHPAQVARDLAVVLLGVFQSLRLDGTHRARSERREPKFRLKCQIGDVDILHRRAHVAFPAVLGQHTTEVVDVHRTAQALAAKHRIGAQLVGHAAVAEHVGEVQLATGLQHAVDFGEHLVFKRRQVDYAVGNHQVNRAIFNAELFQVLDIARLELHVRMFEPELFSLLVLILLRNGKLLGGHVDADDAPGRPHKLREHVHVAPRAAAQIDHRRTGKRRRNRRAAPIEALDDLVGDVGHHVEHVLRRTLSRAAACVGLQVVGAAQRLAVILAHLSANVVLLVCHINPPLCATA